MATWGRTGHTGWSSSAATLYRGDIIGLGGAWTATNQQLDSFSFAVTANSSYVGYKLRFAVYSGGSVSDWNSPAYPTLVYDFGEYTIQSGDLSSFKTLTTTGTVSIPDNDPLWLVIVTDNSNAGDMGVVDRQTTLPYEDFDASWTYTDTRASSTAFTSTADFDLGTTTGSRTWPMYITHSDAAATGGPGITPKEGRTVLANIVYKNADANRGTSLQLGLLTNSTVLDENAVLGDITEPTSAGGYARKTLTNANWTVSVPDITYTLQQFQASGADFSAPIYGWFICTTGTSPKLLHFQQSAGAPYTIIDGAIVNVPLDQTIS